MLNMTEIIVILLVVLLLFGAKRLPDLARALGKSVNEFKKAKDGIIDEKDENEAKESKDGKEAKDSKSDGAKKS